MSLPAVFVLLQAKLDDVDVAYAYLQMLQARQLMISTTHPQIYSQQEHAQLVAINLQAIYSKLEGLLADLIKELDGDLPRSDAWHRDLLTLAARPNHPRPAVISGGTKTLMTELLAFRHVVRSRYSSELRAPDVFKNLGIAETLLPALKADLQAFVAVLHPDQPAHSQQRAGGNTPADAGRSGGPHDGQGSAGGTTTAG